MFRFYCTIDTYLTQGNEKGKLLKKKYNISSYHATQRLLLLLLVHIPPLALTFTVAPTGLWPMSLALNSEKIRDQS